MPGAPSQQTVPQSRNILCQQGVRTKRRPFAHRAARQYRILLNKRFEKANLIKIQNLSILEAGRTAKSETLTEWFPHTARYSMHCCDASKYSCRWRYSACVCPLWAIARFLVTHRPSCPRPLQPRCHRRLHSQSQSTCWSLLHLSLSLDLLRLRDMSDPVCP